MYVTRVLTLALNMVFSLLVFYMALLPIKNHLAANKFLPIVKEIEKKAKKTWIFF